LGIQIRRIHELEAARLDAAASIGNAEPMLPPSGHCLPNFVPSRREPSSEPRRDQMNRTGPDERSILESDHRARTRQRDGHDHARTDRARTDHGHNSYAHDGPAHNFHSRTDHPRTDHRPSLVKTLPSSPRAIAGPR
jgi:hypothetical protein